MCFHVPFMLLSFCFHFVLSVLGGIGHLDLNCGQMDPDHYYASKNPTLVLNFRYYFFWRACTMNADLLWITNYINIRLKWLLDLVTTRRPSRQYAQTKNCWLLLSSLVALSSTLIEYRIREGCNCDEVVFLLNSSDSCLKREGASWFQLVLVLIGIKGHLQMQMAWLNLQFGNKLSKSVGFSLLPKFCMDRLKTREAACVCHNRCVLLNVPLNHSLAYGCKRSCWRLPSSKAGRTCKAWEKCVFHSNDSFNPQTRPIPRSSLNDLSCKALHEEMKRRLCVFLCLCSQPVLSHEHVVKSCFSISIC